MLLLEANNGQVVLGKPGTEYRVSVEEVEGNIPPNRTRVKGHIVVQAKRIDSMKAGGCFIDPLKGRPRRVQGRVLATDPAANTLTVDAALPFVLKVSKGQRADMFTPGQIVGCSVEPGAKLQVEE